MLLLITTCTEVDEGRVFREEGVDLGALEDGTKFLDTSLTEGPPDAIIYLRHLKIQSQIKYKYLKSLKPKVHNFN